MENTEKLKTTKEVIAYVAECFPKCFTLEGEAKPLKIGIFQDLAERLDNDPKVSKTQLRQALRQYTSSWRYLHGVKAGATRVDLDGNDCGVLEEEHVEHAKKALAESKARVAERRKEQAAKTKQENRKANAEPKKAKPRKNKPKQEKKPEVTRSPIEQKDVVAGTAVHVNMGNGDMPATIVEVNKDDVRVQLNNGLQMVVKTEHLRA
jgi:ProP effector